MSPGWNDYTKVEEVPGSRETTEDPYFRAKGNSEKSRVGTDRYRLRTRLLSDLVKFRMTTKGSGKEQKT